MYAILVNLLSKGFFQQVFHLVEKTRANVCQPFAACITHKLAGDGREASAVFVAVATEVASVAAVEAIFGFKAAVHLADLAIVEASVVRTFLKRLFLGTALRLAVVGPAQVAGGLFEPIKESIPAVHGGYALKFFTACFGDPLSHFWVARFVDAIDWGVHLKAVLHVQAGGFAKLFLGCWLK